MTRHFFKTISELSFISITDNILTISIALAVMDLKLSPSLEVAAMKLNPFPEVAAMKRDPSQDFGFELNHKDAVMDSKLHQAARQGNLKMVKYLHNQGDLLKGIDSKTVRRQGFRRLHTRSQCTWPTLFLKIGFCIKFLIQKFFY